jgi:hypothetical protein
VGIDVLGRRTTSEERRLMSELSQAERIAAIKAKRAAAAADKAVDAVQPVAAAPSSSRQITLTKPTPQRVAAAGVSVVSFAAMTMAMGPLSATANTVNEDAVDDEVADPTVAEVPRATSGVVVEVVPHYLAMTADGTPLPEGTLLPDGTLATAAEPAELVPNELSVAGSELTAAPAATAAPAPAATAAPAPAATAAPATTAAPVATAAPAATAAPVTAAAPAATNPLPPPKSEASG